MNRPLLQSVRFCFMVACAVALAGGGVVTATQVADPWVELGENFSDSGTETSSEPIVGTTYILPSSGTEVIVADPLEPQESDMDDQLIFLIPQGMGAVAVLPGLQSPQAAMEAYVSAFAESPGRAEELDLQLGEDSAMGLFEVEVSGEPLFMLITVDYHTMPGYITVQVALAGSDVAGSVSYMRENIHVNSQPMFTDVDELEIQEIVEQYLAL